VVRAGIAPGARRVTLVAETGQNPSSIVMRAGIAPGARRVTLMEEAGQDASSLSACRLADRDRREPDRGARRQSARRAPRDARGSSRAGPEHNRGARRHSAWRAPRDARSRSRIGPDRCVRGLALLAQGDARGAGGVRDRREPDRGAHRPSAGRAPRDARGRSRTGSDRSASGGDPLAQSDARGGLRDRASPIAVRAGLVPAAHRVTLVAEAGRRLSMARTRGPQLRLAPDSPSSAEKAPLAERAGARPTLRPEPRLQLAPDSPPQTTGAGSRARDRSAGPSLEAAAGCFPQRTGTSPICAGRLQ